MLQNGINDTQREIIRWLNRLDEFVIAKEAEWGIGNLQKWCSVTTADKMARQDKKLASAIERQDIRAVQDLVNGTMRGYEVMEEEAAQNGHKPIAPEYMEVKLESGFHLRIAKTSTEARGCTESGVYVWSLKEVARVIESDYTLVNRLKEVIPEAEVKDISKNEFDWEAGDSVLF